MSEPTCDWAKSSSGICEKKAVYVSVGIKDKVPHKYLCEIHGLQMVALQCKKGFHCRVVPCDPFVLYEAFED